MDTIAKMLSTMALISAAAHGQAPPDVVTSDEYRDTAVGTGVLMNISPGFGQAAANRNTGVGTYALLQDTTGAGNTAVGSASLAANTLGNANTALGSNTLVQNVTGSGNTAAGFSTLASNTSGSNNVALGSGALFGNTTGQFNTGSGDQALAGGNNPDMTGSYNTADGAEALFSNTTGGENTAAGSFALTQNTTGNNNTASGLKALYSNQTGNGNSAFGANTLWSDKSGSNNLALGNYALFNSTGSTNLGLGANAGYNVKNGSNNVEIANEGLAGDDGIIRIGAASTQTAAYIAGIENSKVTGAAVYVTSSGQLGVLASSERYKTDIAPIGARTEKLGDLRPVSYHLRTDPQGAVQYGLIAEEVAQVYPELVIRDERGTIQGIRYEELTPMLLGEMQKQADEVKALKRQLADIQAALALLQLPNRPHAQ